MIDIKELDSLARGAAQEPWRYEAEGCTGGVWSGQELIFGGDRWEGYLAEDDPNVQFILAANPTTILSLLNELRKAKETIRMLEKSLEGAGR